MTKPITSVAAMMLWEEGRFELTDPISRWLPEFADLRVYAKGSALKPFTVPATEPIRVWHLLTHTAGLTYGFLQTSVVDGLYRAAGFELAPPAGRRPGRAPARRGPRCRCCSSPAPRGTTRSPPTCSAGWSRWSPGSRSTRSSPSGSSARWA